MCGDIKHHSPNVTRFSNISIHASMFSFMLFSKSLVKWVFVRSYGQHLLYPIDNRWTIAIIQTIHCQPSKVCLTLYSYMSVYCDDRTLLLQISLYGLYVTVATVERVSLSHFVCYRDIVIWSRKHLNREFKTEADTTNKCNTDKIGFTLFLSPCIRLFGIPLVLVYIQQYVVLMVIVAPSRLTFIVVVFCIIVFYRYIRSIYFWLSLVRSQKVINIQQTAHTIHFLDVWTAYDT